MTKFHPPYAAAFRERMVALVPARKSPTALAREFNCTAQSISNWVAESTRDSKPSKRKDGLSTLEREELVRLRRQVRQLQTERDILAKATAWFAVKSEKTSTPSSN